MTVWHRFEQRVAAAWPPADWHDVAVVVAVSGGCDSVALVRALAHLRDATPGRLVVAHFNHQWRGVESAEDEAFVCGLADQCGLACDVGRGEPSPVSAGDGLEAAARQQRYHFLREVSDRWGARYVATAHTADDQVETILHRIVRGTGLAGLAGIPRTRLLSSLTTVIRPLLRLKRPEVLGYLDDLGQPFRTDASNTWVEFTRNRIRHELLPALQRDYNPRVADAVHRLGELARQAQQVIDTLVEALRVSCVTQVHAGHVRIECGPLREQASFLIRELLIAIWREQQWPLQDMSGAKWHELCRLVQDPDATRQVVILPGPIRAEGRGLVIELTCQSS
ncbi:MAG: tRNA lysidine(34) synthetase TilS [Pirellulaceae bacterium]